MKLIVIHENEGGELHRQFAHDENHAAHVMIAMMHDLRHLQHGDRFRVVEVEESSASFSEASNP